MSEKKKSFREFLANDALNPGVTDDKLQKVDVGSREAENSGKDGKKNQVVAKISAPKIKQKPVALFGVLCFMFLGLTIGLSFVSLWALFGIIPTLLCFWKMVLNNADNNYNSIVYRYDSDYLERIDGKEKNNQKCQEAVDEIEMENKKEEKKSKVNDKEDNEMEIEHKKGWNGKKNVKSKYEDDDEELSADDEDEEDEEEEKDKDDDDDKKKEKAEKSDKKYDSKAENSDKRDVENDKSKTSLKDRNNGIGFVPRMLK